MAKKKPVKRISWKTEYFKLANKVSTQMSDIGEDLTLHRKDRSETSDRLDKLAWKYQNIFNKKKSPK